MHALLLSTNTDLPSCTIHLPLHTIPATPRDMMIRFRSLKSSSTAFPLCPQGQHLHFKLTRLHLGSLALRSAVLPRGNLQHLITQTLLPGAKEVYEQLLLRDFNPIRFIADNGIRTAPFLMIALSSLLFRCLGTSTNEASTMEPSLAIIPLELRVTVNKSKSFSVSPFLHS